MQVTTIEGLGAPGRVSALQAALLRHRAFQCGFCVPGFLASATEILGSGVATAASSSELLSRMLPLHRLRAARRGGVRMPTIGTDDHELLVTGRGFIADLALMTVSRWLCPLAGASRRDPIGRSRLHRGDLGAQLGLQPLRLEAGGMATVLWHPLPTERVRYVGEPVAAAWGEDRYAAEDLAEAVSVDYAPLPAGTPLHDAAPDGCCSPARLTPAAWTR